jgi:tetratricopeptide (TPR) repeat protein
MWRYKLQQLYSAAPEFVTTDTQEKCAFKGKYLHIDDEPFALGKVIGEGDESQVFELISLRHGYFDRVLKLCKHKRGSKEYRRWANEVRDEVNPHSALPQVEHYPAGLIELPCGGIAKIQSYYSPNPECDWASSYPAVPIIQLIRAGNLDGAEHLCQAKIESHGRKAIFLEQLALIQGYRGHFENARNLFEECISAHRTEGNSAVLGAFFNLALTLVRLHESESLPGTMKLNLGGIIYQQRITEHSVIDLSDVALEVLIEALTIEPYYSTAIDLTCNIIGGGGEAESYEVLAEAFLQIDRNHPHADGIAHELHRLRAWQAENVGKPLETPPEIPPHVKALLDKENAEYEPPVPPQAAEAESLFHASQQHLSGGDYVRAERDLRRACELNKRESKYVVGLSDLWCSRGEWERAEKWLKEHVSHFPDDPVVYEAQGRVYSELRRYRDSCVAFHKALACQPPDDERWVIQARLGTQYRKLGKLENAMQNLREAYKNRQEELLVNMFLLQGLKDTILELREKGLESEGTLAEANAVLEKAKAAGILGAELLFIKGQIMMTLVRSEEALEALGEAMKLDPAHPYAASAYDAVKKYLDDQRQTTS